MVWSSALHTRYHPCISSLPWWVIDVWFFCIMFIHSLQEKQTNMAQLVALAYLKTLDLELFYCDIAGSLESWFLNISVLISMKFQRTKCQKKAFTVECCLCCTLCICLIMYKCYAAPQSSWLRLLSGHWTQRTHYALRSPWQPSKAQAAVAMKKVCLVSWFRTKSTISGQVRLLFKISACLLCSDASGAYYWYIKWM